MFQLDFNRAKSAVEEVKQAIAGIQPVLELKPVSHVRRQEFLTPLRH